MFSSTETKELHFAVSFIGDFYQIYGLDLKQNNKPNEKKSVEAIITSSPYEEFEEPFNFVEK